MITFDDFKKVELTVGKILSAEKVPETDKLLKLSVDFGTKLPLSPPLKKEGEEIPPAVYGVPLLEKGKQERDIRQIISGIALHFPEPEALVGKKCVFVTNIPIRVIKGLESNGMILAIGTDDGKFSLLEPNAEIQEGTQAK